MDIMRSLKESIMGWQYAFSNYAGIKAGEATQLPGIVAHTGIRYIPTGVTVSSGGAVVDPATVDPGTPATVIETIQKSIRESAEGWRMGYAHVSGKAEEAAAIVQREAQETAIGLGYGLHLTSEYIKKGVGGVGESFGDVASGVTDWFKSAKWQMLLPVIILAFIAVMVAIGYSGVGGPAARVAEQEYVKRR